jgi:hypothetical protein
MDITRLVRPLPRRSSDTVGRVALAAVGLRAAEHVPFLIIRVETLLTTAEALLPSADETAQAA